jgi:cytochrome P450
MMMGFYPQIVARKAYQAQQRVSKAFKEYYDAGLDKNANQFIKGRAKVARDHNLDNTILGIFEIAMCFTPVTNVVPTVFWMLSYIYTDAELLQALREEVAILGSPLDITKLRSCPLLISTYQETQRLTQHGNAVRFVTADTTLDGYLLKEGSIIQIPSAVLNTASSTWGPDSRTFNARRFLDSDDKKARQQGFIPFGGGRHLCPGRHLAFTETLGFVAAFVLGFDMEGAQIIGTRTHKMGFGARKPKGDLKVSIKRRGGFENVNWSFNVGSEKDVAPTS